MEGINRSLTQAPVFTPLPTTHTQTQTLQHATMQAHHVVKRLTAADIPKAHELEVLSYPEVRVCEGGGAAAAAAAADWVLLFAVWFCAWGRRGDLVSDCNCGGSHGQLRYLAALSLRREWCYAIGTSPFPRPSTQPHRKPNNTTQPTIRPHDRHHKEEIEGDQDQEARFMQFFCSKLRIAHRTLTPLPPLPNHLIAG